MITTLRTTSSRAFTPSTHSTAAATVMTPSSLTPRRRTSVPTPAGRTSYMRSIATAATTPSAAATDLRRNADAGRPPGGRTEPAQGCLESGARPSPESAHHRGGRGGRERQWDAVRADRPGPSPAARPPGGPVTQVWGRSTSTRVGSQPRDAADRAHNTAASGGASFSDRWPITCGRTTERHPGATSASRIRPRHPPRYPRRFPAPS